MNGLLFAEMHRLSVIHKKCIPLTASEFRPDTRYYAYTVAVSNKV